MADILIRGIEIPENDSIIVAIRSDGKIEDVMGCYIGTAVELPPHGDLVEADYLKTIAYARGKEYSCVAFVDPVDIAIAPVIVPSSKEIKNAN